MTKKKPARYRFVGQDEYIPGVPARDLTPEEYDAARVVEPLDLTKDELAASTDARAAHLERLYLPDSTPLEVEAPDDSPAPLPADGATV